MTGGAPGACRLHPAGLCMLAALGGQRLRQRRGKKGILLRPAMHRQLIERQLVDFFDRHHKRPSWTDTIKNIVNQPGELIKRQHQCTLLTHS